MADEQERGFDYTLGAETGVWDAFAEEGDDENPTGYDQVEAPDLPPDPARMANAPASDPDDSDLPAEQRIKRLFERMRTRRRVLLGMLDYLQEPRNPSDLTVRVDELQEHDYSMFKAVNYAALLEQAGAIEKLNDDGTPFDSTYEQAPDRVIVDGVRFYRPAVGRRILWCNTAAGQAYLDADRPADRLRAMLEEERRYAGVFQRVLAQCSVEGGTTMAAITPLVDDDPITVNPRLYAPHFVDLLEQCEAIRWDGSWHITEIGREGLALLADMTQEGE